MYTPVGAGRPDIVLVEPVEDQLLLLLAHRPPRAPVPQLALRKRPDPAAVADLPLLPLIQYARWLAALLQPTRAASAVSVLRYERSHGASYRSTLDENAPPPSRSARAACARQSATGSAASCDSFPPPPPAQSPCPTRAEPLRVPSWSSAAAPARSGGLRRSPAGVFSSGFLSTERKEGLRLRTHKKHTRHRSHQRKCKRKRKRKPDRCKRRTSLWCCLIRPRSASSFSRRYRRSSSNARCSNRNDATVIQPLASAAADPAAAKAVQLQVVHLAHSHAARDHRHLQPAVVPILPPAAQDAEPDGCQDANHPNELEQPGPSALGHNPDETRRAELVSRREKTLTAFTARPRTTRRCERGFAGPCLTTRPRTPRASPPSPAPSRYHLRPLLHVTSRGADEERGGGGGGAGQMEDEQDERKQDRDERPERSTRRSTKHRCSHPRSSRYTRSPATGHTARLPC